MKPYLFVLFSGLAIACGYETYQAYREHREMLDDPQWQRKRELKKQADKYLIAGSPEHAKFLEDAMKRSQATDAAIHSEGDARLPWRIKTVAEGFVSGKSDKSWIVSSLAVQRLGSRSEDRATFVQSYASAFELMPAERAGIPEAAGRTFGEAGRVGLREGRSGRASDPEIRFGL